MLEHFPDYNKNNTFSYNNKPNISLLGLQLIQPYKRLKLLPMLTVQQLERHNIFFFKVIEQQTINKVIAYFSYILVCQEEIAS